MSVQLNETALFALLNTYEGPIGREVELVAQLVATVARSNASGPIIGIKTGNLLGGIQAEHYENEGEAAWKIFTDAKEVTERGQVFYYPAYHDQTSRPWLTASLREVFTI